MRWLLMATVLLAASAAWTEERAYEPDADTVLLLHFDENGGDVAADASASGLEAALLPPPRRPGWEEAGMFGACLRFDGVNADEDGDGAGEDWPGFFREGYACVREEALAPPLELAWSVNTGGRVFDAATGEPIWEHQFAYTAAMAEHSQRQAYAGQSTPLVAGGIVDAASDDGHLHAFALDDGELLWRHNLGVPLKGSPVVSGNALYICDWDGNLY